MAFDWTKIEGYDESMSAEEKLTLLEKIEEPEPEAKKEEPAPAPKPIGSQVSKQQYDKVSSELAALKKQLRSKMTEDEQREADRLATEEAMKMSLQNCVERSSLVLTRHRTCLWGSMKNWPILPLRQWPMVILTRCSPR